MTKVVSLKLLPTICHLEIKAAKHIEDIVLHEHVKRMKFIVGYPTQCREPWPLIIDSATTES